MRRVSVDVSAADIDLVREAGTMTVRSFEIGMRPRAVPDHKQPTEWHEGQTLLALAKRLAAAYRKAKP